jgi:hypothetical protein
VTASSDRAQNLEPLRRRHLIAGWGGLLVFLTLGIVLESLLGLKAAYYLDVRNSVRREMWRLAHTHGTLIALIQIAFALSVGRIPRPAVAGRLAVVSGCLLAGLVCLPAGFFLGGLWFYEGDPGVGVLLVPAGALMLLVGVGTFLWLLASRGETPQASALDVTAESSSRSSSIRSRGGKRR